jgi:hypothetical protein
MQRNPVPVHACIFTVLPVPLMLNHVRVPRTYSRASMFLHVTVVYQLVNMISLLGLAYRAGRNDLHMRKKTQ